MRIALFGSGSPLSVSALQHLRSAGRTPSVVVVPAAAYAKPLIEAARQQRIEVIVFEAGLARRLRTLNIDLTCIASFPHILKDDLLAIPAINVHTSLLPRHRGIDPIFWTYYYGEETTGVTVHWIDRGCDSGDILSARSVDVPLGRPSRELYFELCEAGSSLLCEVFNDLDGGRAKRLAQDQSEATHDPPPTRENIRTDFSAWTVRRAWHYLAGMSDQRNDLIVDPFGGVVRHGRAMSWEQTDPTDDRIEERRGSIVVNCRDGSVTLEAARSTLQRILRRLRRLTV